MSGEATDISVKYKIREYDKAYADALKDDRNFNIVARMMILKSVSDIVKKRLIEDSRVSTGDRLQSKLLFSKVIH